MKNIFHNIYRKLSLKLQFSKKRSYGYGWTKVRKKHIMQHPRCAICGYLSFSNDVHHITPRHVDESRLLDEDNLVTLCSKYKCHLRFGHFGNFAKYWNPNIREFINVGDRMHHLEASLKCSAAKEKY
tara:strand:+ start:4643 stop:5023 length:381 start_codon:yes stop_codon:yes gene_type:complete